MKWIGQHIWSFISRFRSDVYLESIADASEDTDKFLVAKSDGKVAYRTGAEVLSDIGASSESTDLEFNGAAANGVLTYGGAAVIDVESTLNYVATSETLKIGAGDAGDATITRTLWTGGHQGDLYIKGANASVGSTDINGGDLFLYGGISTGTGTEGKINFYTSDAAGGSANSQNASATRGYFDGDGLQVSGTLTMGSTAFVNNSGVVQVAAQTNITSLGTLTSLDVDNININGDTITASADLSIVATGNDIAIDTDNLVIESATNGKPEVELKSTTNTNKGSVLKFTSDKGAAGVDDDIIGTIIFVGDDDHPSQQQTNYAKIIGSISDASNTDEAGKLEFQVAESDGSATQLTTGLLIEGEHATDGEVDVTIGAGTGCTTTINGKIALGHATDTILARGSAGIVTIQNKQIFTTNTPALTSGAAGVPAVTMQTRRTITTGEANSMNTTPIELVPAQGANTIIVPIGGVIRADRAATQTNSSADLNMHYESLEPGTFLQTSVAHVRRFMYNETGDRVFSITACVIAAEIGQNLTSDTDKALEVSFDAATTTNCFTSIDIFLTYQVISIA